MSRQRMEELKVKPKKGFKKWKRFAHGPERSRSGR